MKAGEGGGFPLGWGGEWGGCRQLELNHKINFLKNKLLVNLIVSTTIFSVSSLISAYFDYFLASISLDFTCGSLSYSLNKMLRLLIQSLCCDVSI